MPKNLQTVQNSRRIKCVQFQSISAQKCLKISSNDSEESMQIPENLSSLPETLKESLYSPERFEMGKIRSL